MKLYVDLETLQLIEAPGFRSPITSLRFKRGDASTLEVAFLTSAATVHSFIGDGETLAMEFGVKVNAAYASGYLVHETAWTMPDPEAAAPVYVCSPGFNTVELNDAFGVGDPTELASLTLMAEITWREGSGEPTSTRTFTIVVENDVNRGTEGTPESQPSPEAWLSARALRINAAQSLTHAQRNTAHANMRDDELLTLELSPSASNGSVSHQQWIRGFHGTFSTATSPTVSVKSSTGYARVMRWDGTLGAKAPTSGGNPANAISPSFGTAIATPYNVRLMKGFSVFACDSNGNLCSDTVAGYLTSVTIANLSGVHCAALTELTTLSLEAGTYSKLDLTNCTKLVSLTINSPALRDLRLPAALSTLTALTLKKWSYDSFDLSFFPNLANLTVSDCAALTSVNVASCPSLASMSFTNCPHYVLSVPAGRTTMTNIVLDKTAVSGALTPASLGLTSIETLTVSNQAALTGVDLTGLTTVTNATFSTNPLQTSFDAGAASITSLSLASLAELVTIDVSSATIDTLTLDSLAKLIAVDLSGMTLSAVNIWTMALLTTLTFTGTTVVQAVNVSSCPALTGALALPQSGNYSVNFVSVPISSFSMGSNQPPYLTVSGTYIISLTLPSNVQSLMVKFNSFLSTLSVGSQSNLLYMEIVNNNSLVSLDLTGIPISFPGNVYLCDNAMLAALTLRAGFIVANSTATLDISGNSLNQGALEAIFGTIGNVSSYTGVVIDTTGNPGAETADQSDALANGWAVLPELTPLE